VSAGYGLHLFDPAWFEGKDSASASSPTVVPSSPPANTTP